MQVKTFNLIKWVLFPIFFFWCFLQNMLGFFVFIYSKLRGHCKRIKTEDGIIYFEVDNQNKVYGVSLGYWVFLNETYKSDKITHHHEWGHQIQSLILGPLYLFLIGLPSGLSNVFRTAKDDLTYYNYPWERWADKLGSVLHSKFYYEREIKKD